MFHIQTVSDYSETVKDLQKLGYDENLKPIGKGSSKAPVYFFYLSVLWYVSFFLPFLPASFLSFCCGSQKVEEAIAKDDTSAPMHVETPEEALQNLVSWVSKRGGIVSADVKVDSVGKGGGGRGLVATIDLKGKEEDGGKDCVLSLPENVLMSRRTACLYGGLHKVLESKTEMPDDEVHRRRQGQMPKTKTHDT